MGKAKAQTPDSFADIFFPARGVNMDVSANDIPPGFTPVGENVRLFDTLALRARGGSRSGIDHFIPEQHSGDFPIQHLTSIVTVDGSLLGWSFDGPNQGFPGVYGGIGFLEQIPGGTLGYPGLGGGGYQPIPTIDSRRLTMGFRRNTLAGGVIAMSENSVITLSTPAGSPPDVVVRVRIINQDGRSGDYLVENVTLHTIPSGMVGDGETLPTQFDLDPPPVGVHGLAEVIVTSSLPRTVDYFATNSAVNATTFVSHHNVRIRWTPYHLVMTASAASAPTSSPVTITGILKNHLGAFVQGKVIQIQGSGGDGVPSLDTTDASGEVTFEVTSPTSGLITYNLTELSESVDAVETVDVTYGDDGVVYRQSAIVYGETSFDPVTMDFSVSLPMAVLEDSLIVVSLGFWSRNDLIDPDVVTLTVTDSLGNTYSLAATVSQVDNGNLPDYVARNRGEIHFVAGTDPGSLEVTVTVGGFSPEVGGKFSIAVHEYVNADPAAPLFDTATNSGISLAASVGAPAIDAAGDLIFACYSFSEGSLYVAAVVTAANFTARESHVGELDSPDVQMGTADYEIAAASDACSWDFSPTVPPDPSNQYWVALTASFKKA